MDYLELAQTNTDVKKKMVVAINDFDKGNLQSQAKAGRLLAGQMEGMKAALNIAGDCIYEKSVENDALRTMIGEVDENFVKSHILEKKKNDNIDDKNKRILEELRKTMNRTQQLKP